MRYFLLEEDSRVGTRWHLGAVHAAGKDVWRELIAGRRYEGPSPIDVKVQYAGPPLAFTYTALLVPVAAHSLAEVVGSFAPRDVQRIPALIDGRPGFEILNAVRLANCLDERTSEFKRSAAGRTDYPYDMVRKVRVDPARIPANVHLFRIAGWHQALLVSEKLKSAIERVGARGARFAPAFDDESSRVTIAQAKAWDVLSEALVPEIGSLEGDALASVVGFSAGGPLCFRTAPVGDGYRHYLSCELLDDPEQQADREGAYELLITSDDEEWVRKYVTELARQGHEFALANGHTVDLGPIIGRSAPIQGFALEEMARVQFEGRPLRVLRCHGVLRSELEYARARSVDALLMKLKGAGVFPRTSTRRTQPVV